MPTASSSQTRQRARSARHRSGTVWFANSKEVVRETCWRSGWWLWIEVPDGAAEYELADGEPYDGNYALSLDFVNTRERTFEPGS